MTWPAVRAQVAFDTDPLDTPTWTTIHEGATTRRVMSATAKHGRQFELDAFQPGQMTLELDNSDRRFDPLHATGPYFGKLLPRKRCRLRADWGAYLNLTGAATSGAGTADTAVLDIVGDIDIRCRVAPADWTPAANAVLVAKATITGQYSYALGLTTGGALQLTWSTTGLLAGVLASTSTVAVGAADGATRWVRAALDVDDGAGNRVTRFYTSTDDTHDHTAVSWTQLGSTVTTAGTTSIFSGSAAATVGILADGNAPMTGKIYAAAILAGIGGTAVANPDFTDGNRFTAGTLTGTDSAGRSWTVTAPASLVAVTYDLFSGFVDTWPQDYGRFQATAEMTATDAFKILSKIDLADAYTETVRADHPAGWWRLGDDTPTSSLCADASGNGRDGLYLGGPVKADSIVDGTTDGAVDFDGANDKLELPVDVCPTASPFTVELWVTTSQVPAAGADAYLVHASATFGNSAGWVDAIRVSLDETGVVDFKFIDYPTLNVVSTVSTSVVNDGAVHHVACTVDTDRRARIYIDGALQGTSAGPAAFSAVLAADRLRVGAPRGVAAGYKKFDGILDEVALYTTALTSAQVLAHYQAGASPWIGDTTGARIGRVLTLAGWPTSDRDIDTGRSTMGPYEGADSNVLAIAQQAETTEGGALWQSPDGAITFRDRHATIQDWNATTSQAAFTDDGTATAPNHYTTLDLAYDDTLIVNDAAVGWSGGTETSTDQTSIDAYTRQAIQIDTALTTAPEARDRGDWLLARYSEPSVRPERVVLRPAADSRLWRHCLARRIGDRVTVRRLPQNTGAAIQFDATIESISHRLADGRNTWETEFGLSPTAVDLGWLILDDATDGLVDTGRLAF